MGKDVRSAGLKFSTMNENGQINDAQLLTNVLYKLIRHSIRKKVERQWNGNGMA